ncbi:hypothetical protein CEV08_00900 [Bartonella tribocorum]|uniref:Uncharacterized protein n=1 Tax=Bartonella tribocorum TaxID=85701 RepID=A0A2M6UYB6_9HYPH|nr:hypothetical protein CEV08_00900 [Bartonella tribocorum]
MTLYLTFLLLALFDGSIFFKKDRVSKIKKACFVHLRACFKEISLNAYWTIYFVTLAIDISHQNSRKVYKIYRINTIFI